MTVPTSNENGTVVVPNRERTVIIIDWDDTLLASTWLSMNDLRLDGPQFIEPHLRIELQELEQRVSKFLDRSLTLGTVLFVTNAETGWIELSCAKFLPTILSYLPKVKIVSARTKYEESYPNQPHQWKIHAFREEIHQALNGSSDLGNVISIGDSHHEREALHIVTSSMENTLVKSVKFVERPGMEVLRRQIELLHGCIEYITQHSGDLDLMLSQSLLFGNESLTPTPNSTWENNTGIAAVSL